MSNIIENIPSVDPDNQLIVGAKGWMVKPLSKDVAIELVNWEREGESFETWVLADAGRRARVLELHPTVRLQSDNSLLSAYVA